MIKSLVVGTSRGIGLGIAQTLLDNNHIVIGLARNNSKLNNFENYTHENIDISCEKSFENYLKKQKLEEFDNFIICAGTNDVSTLDNITIDRLIKLYKVNLFPSFQLLKYISKSKKSKNKSIVLFGSIWSSFGISGRSMYGTSKAALVALTKHASSELSSRKIHINCISPGFTNTELSSQTKNDPLISKALERSSQKSFQEIDAISNGILMLLQPHNKGITGQEIFIDSGFSSHA